MKSKDDIAQDIKYLVEEVSLGATAADSIRGEDKLMADLKLDSLDYATVLLGCARLVGTNVREDGVDWSEIVTVDQLATFLETQQS
ncbi:MAG: hypothetical protein AAF394_01325 [Planctomycetota bacterium]